MLGIFNEIKSDLQVLDKKLQKVVSAEDLFLSQMASYLLKAGGKRLRPAFAFLSARFYNYKLENVLPLAVALELIHMASLVHDDVVDAAATRRGVPTVRAKWGNRMSMHVGDWIFAKSLMMISEYEKIPMVAKTLSQISVKMCEGEIQQISSAYKVEQTIKDYFYRIERKTALLISASCQLGAVVCGAPEAIHLPLKRFGYKIGIAFQIVDDVLDLSADQKELGKPVGGDLRQGIITLPMIYALKNSAYRERLSVIIQKHSKSEEEIQEAISLISKSGGIDYANSVVDRYVTRAKEELEHLPNIPARDVLYEIAGFVKNRKF